MDEQLSSELIQQDLPTRFIGQKVIFYKSLDSTMDAAKMEAQWGADAGTVIVAGEQTKGRGRLHRTWLSPEGGLAFSVILRPNISHLHYMIMLASLAVTYSIRSVTGLNPQIKWPNDVLIADKKVCGILIENDIRKNILKHTVIGIGLNVNVKISQYSEIAQIATSLSDQLKKPVSKLEMIRAILTEMDRLYAEFLPGDLLYIQWRNNLVTLGQQVQVNMGNKVYTGLAERVTDNGTLILRQKDGHTVDIIAGEVM
jgi:BirA family transcriptional regulator, biotin operon repressor / biotin---[acetyl-CoA-carboxylase] ligase